jgi:uncharacterized repeat protein (TIGR03833 family)
MYYQTKSNRYYKLRNRKSVRVTKQEAEDNLFQLNKLTLTQLKKILTTSEGEKDQLIKKLVELIKKDEKLEYKVKELLKNKTVKRIESQKPSKGDIVRVIIKPYDEGNTKLGVVKDVLTRKEVHTRGHKVRLHNGVVGRLVKIIKKKK